MFPLKDTRVFNESFIVIRQLNGGWIDSVSDPPNQGRCLHPHPGKLTISAIFPSGVNRRKLSPLKIGLPSALLTFHGTRA